ncbi:hypothetical protein DY000_02052171 [Brassica cretica]|uniref:RNase H type-1 domain-containing protein n=1 Tax=Brassica cretica TaxID=69181 RepID=A0ABQ7A8Z5_BRACR|nr:hypothetical protein DY000_02052171 [Brassica cretica]
MLSSSLSPSLHYTTSQIAALLHKIEYWSLDHATNERNVAANMIAGSVATGHRYQSYIASQGEKERILITIRDIDRKNATVVVFLLLLSEVSGTEAD